MDHNVTKTKRRACKERLLKTTSDYELEYILKPHTQADFKVKKMFMYKTMLFSFFNLSLKPSGPVFTLSVVGMFVFL